MSKAKLIEHKKDYIEQVLLDHPEQGRIYVTMMKKSESEVPTWRDGLGIIVKPGDTIESIDAMREEVINDYCTTAYDAMVNGYDADRRPVEWPGYMIESMVWTALDK